MTDHWKARLGIVLVFVLGCLAGGLAASAFFSHRTAAFLQRGSAAYLEILEHRLTRNLHLDAAQKQEVHEYLLENLEKRKILQLQIKPQVRVLNQRTLDQIRSILAPEQITVLQKNLASLHQRFGVSGEIPATDATNNAPVPPLPGPAPQ